jgi:hypothetical protein
LRFAASLLYFQTTSSSASKFKVPFGNSKQQHCSIFFEK